MSAISAISGLHLEVRSAAMPSPHPWYDSGIEVPPSVSVLPIQIAFTFEKRKVKLGVFILP